jgi:SAM-dependent methyltransferase
MNESLYCLLCNTKGRLLYEDMEDRLYGFPGKWSLLDCPSCGLIWLNPRPTLDELKEFYKNYLTHELPDPTFTSLKRFFLNSVLYFQLGYQGLVLGRFQRILGRLFSLFGPIREMAELSVMTLRSEENGRLLDIGCGSGEFLVRMKEFGWDVVGIEPDPEAVKVCQNLSLNVIEGTIEEVDLPNNQFDVVTMNHVIEHVLDPIKTFKKCYHTLKIGGRLIVVTQNTEGLGRRCFGKSWRGWDVPRHIYSFNLQTIKDCAERVGFRCVKIYTASRMAHWIWHTSRLIKRYGFLPRGTPKKGSLLLWAEGFAFHFLEYGFSKIKNMGEEIVLIATK